MFTSSAAGKLFVYVPPQTYLEHVNHVLAVPLLGDITEAGGDVDAAADVHVHLHGLLLDLTVQI